MGKIEKTEFKHLLESGFEAPVPVRKKEFLRKLDNCTPSMNYLDVLLTQTTYIRKWTWGLSIIIFAIALIGAEYMEQNIIWCISAFMPILAMTAVTETGRSEHYNMAEFEFSTRFSLKTVILARLCILGITNLIVICILTPLTCLKNETTFIQTGIYMLCPYLLTTCAGLWIVRNIHGKESVYLCAGLAAGISIGNILLYTKYADILTSHNHFIWWIIAAACFGIGTIRQCYQIIKQTEELAWN